MKFKKALIAMLIAAGLTAGAAEIKCAVTPDYSVMPAGKARTGVVQVSLSGGMVAASGPRPSVNFALVIDRSGSMQGKKIVHAREAACAAVNQLDAGDFVSVVIFDDTCETIVPEQSAAEKEAIIEKINAITPRGGTAIFEGVSRGAAEIRKQLGKTKINRVILLSDGCANVGPSTPEELGRLGAALKKEGISVSTVGVGTDYNEDLMLNLSQNSDGNSYFVENSDDLPRVFAAEIGNALTVAATQVSLSVKFAAGFVPVALVGRDGRISGDTVTVDFNQIYAGQEKYVLVKADIPPFNAGEKADFAVATVTFTDPRTDKRQTVTATGAAAFSDDKEAVKASLNRKVLKDAALNLNAQVSETALSLSDDGEIDGANALLDRAVFELKAVKEEIGEDADISAAVKSLTTFAESVKQNSVSGAMRKALKTENFQLRNQQNVR